MLRLSRIREREDGAIAIIVAMLFFFGVMLALGALTVDVGNINADRRQLQNGADAVALAVAQQCATDGTCDVVTLSKIENLQKLADANAADNATSIRRVDQGTPVGTPAGTPAICGTLAGLPKCPTSWNESSSMSNLQECPSKVADDVNYVRVYAETENSDHKNILPYYFGAALTGISSANQQACATAALGSPAGTPAPFTLSYCEWAYATGNDPANPSMGGASGGPIVYAPSPGDTWPGYGGTNSDTSAQPAWPKAATSISAPPVPGAETIVSLQEPNKPPATSCHTWNTHDVPGGFGYLSTSTGCSTTAPIGGWIQVSTGLGLQCDLSAKDANGDYIYFNKVIYLPIFDCNATGTSKDPPPWPPGVGSPCSEGAGNTTWYHIEGYAGFYLSGYKVGGSSKPIDQMDRTQTGTAPCDNPSICLSGWFIKGLVNTPPAPPSPPGAPSFGVHVLGLIR